MGKLVGIIRAKKGRNQRFLPIDQNPLRRPSVHDDFLN
jgi:hypothetical protein